VSRLFIILLIALLPLRGWSAERMAVHMAVSESATSAMSAEHGTQHEDCAMMMAVDSSDTSSTDHGGKTERSCQTCQLCMTLAAHEIPAVQAIGPAPHSVAIPRADRYTSAELTLAVKPPIF
jgi:hypothetical protein